jgi:hypothetical protein
MPLFNLLLNIRRLGIFVSPLNRYFSQITLTNRIYLHTVYLYFAVVFFLNKKTEIIDVLGVVVFLNKALKVYMGCNSRGEMFNIQKK